MLASTAGTALAQQQTSTGPTGDSLGVAAVASIQRAQASRVEEGPLVDGDVLGDPAYADAAVASGFRQNTPDEGQRSSERTEVRIVYTDDTLYFGIVCYVSDPETIIVADSRRDSSLNDTDSFQIILDTFLDHQNGFVFGTNPAGVEYDGQLGQQGCTADYHVLHDWSAAVAKAQSLVVSMRRIFVVDKDSGEWDQLIGFTSRCSNDHEVHPHYLLSEWKAWTTGDAPLQFHCVRCDASWTPSEEEKVRVRRWIEEN